MNELNDINLPADSDDLSKYAPALHQLRGKGDGFVVPENYFDTLADEIVSGCPLSLLRSEEGFVVPAGYFENLTEELVPNAILRAGNTGNGFVVPEDYFGNLAEEIIAKSKLAEVTGKPQPETGFVVPGGYFENLDSELHTKLALDNLRQDEGFAVPENYFDKLTERITTRAALDETLLKNPEVPAGYFDTLADRITARIREEEKTVAPEQEERGRIIVFSAFVKRYSRTIAVAASAALLIGAALWFMNRNGEPQKNMIAKNDPPKQQLLPPVAPVKKDSAVSVPVQKNTTLAQQAPKRKKQNPKKEVNLQPGELVKVEKNDVMEQMDLLDENTVADFVATNSDIHATDQQLITNPSIEKYLLEDNADLKDILNDINDK